MKKINQIKYVVALGNTIFEHSMRTRKRDSIYDWQRESNLSWKEDKEEMGYRCVRIRLTEEP